MRRIYEPLLVCIFILFLFLLTRNQIESSRQILRSRELYRLFERSCCEKALPEAKRLIALGVDFSQRADNGETVMMLAVRNLDSRSVDLLEKVGVQNDPKTQLFVEVFQERPARVEALLKGGANPNVHDVNNSTPIFYAAILGDVPTIKILLKHGAKYNEVNSEGDAPLDATLTYAMPGNKQAAVLLKKMGALHGSEILRKRKLSHH